MQSLRKSATFSLRHLLKIPLRRCLASKTNEAVQESKPSTEEKTILVEKINTLMYIGINRPEKRNCLNVSTLQQLSDALTEFDEDDSVVSGILYGVGGNFCAGYDLKDIADYDGKNEENIPHFGALSHRHSLTKKPLVAALNGFTVGAGFELALMCDLRIMEESAVLGFLNRRFGIPILWGGTVRLPAMIGYARAMDLILTGRTLTAVEAYNAGLISRKVAHGSAIGQATSLANSLVKFQQRVLLADRASLNYATFSANDIEEAFQFEKDNATHLLFEEGVKGARKFCYEGIGRHGKSRDITPRNVAFRELDPSLI